MKAPGHSSLPETAGQPVTQCHSLPKLLDELHDAEEAARQVLIKIACLPGSEEVVTTPVETKGNCDRFGHPTVLATIA